MIEEQNTAPAVCRDATDAVRPCKVLIVDDERIMIKLIRTVTAELGFTTRDVSDSRQATEVFIEFRPDVLVLDLIMPGKDGIEILDEVLVVDPDVRLVLMSGYGEAGLRLADSVSKFHRRDTAVMLRKPFRIEVLRQVLQQMASVRPD